MSEICPRCHQEVPEAQLQDYSVFYCSYRNGLLDNGILYPLAFGTQHSTVKAASHFDAVCKRASNSQHSDGATYLVVGEDQFDTGPKARLFEINVAFDDDYDFVSYTPGAHSSFRHGKYRVHEVNINGGKTV